MWQLFAIEFKPNRRNSCYSWYGVRGKSLLYLKHTHLNSSTLLQNYSEHFNSIRLKNVKRAVIEFDILIKNLVLFGFEFTETKSKYHSLYKLVGTADKYKIYIQYTGFSMFVIMIWNECWMNRFSVFNWAV